MINQQVAARRQRLLMQARMAIGIGVKQQENLVGQRQLLFNLGAITCRDIQQDPAILS
ncbi:hypothetical protein D3C81_2300390 [compost metagenome]